MTVTITHHTPLGPLALTASATGLTRARFADGPPTQMDGLPTHTDGLPTEADGDSAPALRLLAVARAELDEYFAGQRRAFTVPVDLAGMRPKRRRILAGLAGVDYGSTVSYGELAAALGLTDVDAPRQVGAAMAANPVLVVLPCHRVIGAGGKLVGYAGGLANKRRLLDLEAGEQTLY